MPNDLGAPKRSESGEGALVCSLVAAILAAMAVGLRTGFPDLLATTALRSLGLSWILIHFPWLARLIVCRVVRHDHSLRAWWNCDSLAMLIGLAAVVKGGWIAATFGVSFGSAVMPIGGALVAARLAAAFVHRMDNDRTWQQAIALLAIAGFLGTFAAGAVWGSGYQNPLFVERLAGGAGHIDTLFHAAVSNMIRTQGVPSTGLDGVPFLHYHFGSHWVIAMICNLIDVAVIDFYNVGYAIIFVPFVLQSLLAFASDLSSAEKCGRTSLGFWFVLTVGVAGFLPLDSGFATPAARTSIFVSESYAIGVAVSLLAVAVAIRFFQQHLDNGRRLSVGDWIGGLFLFPTLIAGIGLAKISIMLVLGVSAAYGFLRLKLFRSPGAIIIGLTTIVSAAVTFKLAYSPGYGDETGLEPFGFLRGNVRVEWWSLFWIAYFAWCWVYLFLRCRRAGLLTLSDFARAVRQRELIDIELVFVLAAAGALPGLLLSRWSSTHYFSDYQHWLALGLVLSLIAGRGHNDGSDHTGTGWRSVRLSQVAVGLAVIAVTGTMLLNATTLARQMVAINLDSRGYPAGNTGVGLLLMKGKFADAHATLTRQADELRDRRSGEFAVLDALCELDRKLLGEKRRTALHIPKDDLYWRVLDTRQNSPQAGPLVAPALSGLVSLDGLHEPAPNDRWSGYGYQTYVRPNPGASARTLCDRAKQIGCQQILEIRSVDEPASKVVELECR